MYKVFFAHPDPKLIALYQGRLTPSFNFDSAHNGIMAIRKIRVYKPDIVVSEYALDFITGLGVLRYIRNHKDLHSIPFLFLSDHQDVATGLSLGANGWLGRETHPDDVLDKIYQHIKINQRVLNR